MMDGHVCGCRGVELSSEPHRSSVAGVGALSLGHLWA